MAELHIDWRLVGTALGLALVFEGLSYFLWAERLPGFFLTMAQRPPSLLRILGLTAMVGGLLLVFIARW